MATTPNPTANSRHRLNQRHSPSSQILTPNPPNHYYLPPSTSAAADPAPCPLASAAATDVDILLAQSGYNVKSSDLPLLAERIEQLETLLRAQDAPDLPSFTSDAVLYNPSDMVTWFDSLIGEIGAPPPPAPPPVPSENAFNHVDSLSGGCLWDSTSPDPVEFLDYSGSSWLLHDHDDYYATLEDRVSSSSTQQPLDIPSPSRHPSLAAPPAQIEHIPAPPATNPPATRRCLSNPPHSEHQPTVADQITESPASNFNVNPSVDQQAAVGNRRSKNPSTVRQRQPLAKFPTASSAASIASSNVHGANSYDGVNVKAANRRKRKNGAGEAGAQQGNERKTPVLSASSAGVIRRGGVEEDEDLKEIRQIPAALAVGSVNDCRKITAEDGCDAAAAAEDDDDESGVTLVHLLMACADAIQKNEMILASDMVRDIDRIAASNRGAMGRVAKHFVAALDQRIGSGGGAVVAALPLDPADFAYAHFYEATPYLKFSHFMANQAILEAFDGKSEVHIIDFNLMQGSQWPPLMHALAGRDGGPPRLRLTGIGPPPQPPDDGSNNNSRSVAAAESTLAEVGRKLAEVAKMWGIDFSFQAVVATRLEDVMAEPALLGVKSGEAVAVNAVFQLHRLLHSRAAPLRRLLAFVRRLSPAVFTVVEQHANHNSPIFLERFVDALHYYCTMFDSLDAASTGGGAISADSDHSSGAALLTYAEHYLGREIANIVACEGAARVERHERLERWRQRLHEAGFRPRHLGSNAFVQASMLLNWCSGDGYAVQENGGCLTLGWHSWPLIAASAWQCAGG